MADTDRDWQRVEQDFAENVRRWRERRGLSQDALAAQMAEYGFPFHQATIYKIEKGERPVRLVEGLALAALLGQYLFDLIDAPEDDQTVSLGDAESALASARLDLALLESADLPAKETAVEERRRELRLAERKLGNLRLGIQGKRTEVEQLARLVEAARPQGTTTIAGGEVVQHPETS